MPDDSETSASGTGRSEPDTEIAVHLDESDSRTALADGVRRGLSADQKSLPPIWFYDERGSQLFDDITRLPEYYPARAERQILEDHAQAIVWHAGTDTLVELGSGTSTKTRLLLDAMRDAECLDGFVPFDASAEVLRAAADDIARSYGIPVRGIVGDFNRHLDHIPVGGRRLVAFLGGTIGNMDPTQRSTFLRNLASTLGGLDRLLLGCDLVKDPARLVAAYDDAHGVTAAFDKNALVHVNHALDANFDPSAFEHIAVWNEEEAWIEMRLRSVEAQVVRIRALGLEVWFSEGEDLLTEISAKFTAEQIEQELSAAGFEVQRQWTDSDGDFMVTLARPAR